MRKLLAIAFLSLAACGGGGGGGGGTVATPTFSPAGGTYDATQSVTIASATSGATIHYTTDGSAPTATSPVYAAAVAVTTTTTLKAYAVASGKTDSPVASATYTLQAGAPGLSPSPGTYATAQSVTLTSATAGAAIHYTIDGTTPTAASPAYTAPIALALGASAATTTVKALATAAGFQDSAVTSGTYVIDPAATPAAQPTFSPGAGTYTSVQTVTLSSATAGVTIYYTTDGSTPTTGSAHVASGGTVEVASSLTLKAIAAGNGHTASTVATAAYLVNLPATATPTFSPVAGAVTSGTTVTMSCATSGAAIHYTTDGSTPTAASTLYTAPVAVTAAVTLKAIAVAAGHAASAVASASYTISTGGGSDFTTVCNNVFTKQISLMTTCLHANPEFINAIIGSQQVFCAAMQKEINLGLVTYSPTQGQACTAAVNAMTCAAIFGSEGVSTPAACDAALVGTVANGTGTANRCYSSNDCANGFCTWELASGTCPGLCTAYAGLGNACASSVCADGQTCYSVSGTPVCTAVTSTAGGACPCGGGLWCDGSGASPICRAPLAQGASCTSSSQACATGLSCVGTPATCQPTVGLGGTCTPGAEQTVCGLGYTCDPGTNKCVSYPKTGESCAGTFVCIGAYCDFTVASPICKALVADGGACNSSLFGSDCQSGSCSAGTPHVCVAGSSSICSPP